MLIGLAAILSMPALAKPDCYTPAELHAEQFLRLHSELMVTAYSCKRSSENVDLISAYTAFTQNNLVDLQKADKVMLGFFKARDGDDGIAQLDDMHTKLANAAGQIIADQSLEIFCDNNRNRPVSLYFATPKELQEELKNMAAMTKSYRPLCKTAGHMDKAAR